MGIDVFCAPAFAVIFGGGLLRFLPRRRLPESVVSPQAMLRALAEIGAP
jgi:hypothetical protein